MKLYHWFRKELEKYNLWQIFIYLFFGGLATIVNFATYFIAKDLVNFNLVTSNTISWLAAVLFAFVTNKLWVFHSKTETAKELIFELSKFIFYRVLSYVLDMGTMIFLINVLFLGDFWAKLITQILVVIANYIFSKLFIFANHSKSDETRRN